MANSISVSFTLYRLDPHARTTQEAAVSEFSKVIGHRQVSVLGVLRVPSADERA